MYCSKCGKELPNEARFCPSCGASCTAETADSQPTQREMMQKLKRFQNLQNGTCLECGYQGLMGVVKEQEFTSQQKTAFFVLRMVAVIVAIYLLSPRGFLWGLILGFTVAFLIGLIEKRYKKKILYCPCCDREVLEIK